MAKKKTDLASAAQEATARMFSGSQKQAEKPKQEETKNTAPIIPEATEQANTTSQTAPRPAQKPIQKQQGKRKTHKVFGAWIDKDTLSKWKAYTDTKNITSEQLMLCAINPYIDCEYPITQEEQEAYKEHLKRERELINENARGKRI